MKPSIQMLSPFFCGSFHPEDDDEEFLDFRQIKTSPSSIPRRSFIKRTSFCRTHNTNKNPYSSRGLDKFESLLADLEEKKKMIYAQVDPDDISLVRFSYTSSNNCVPIVVKSKNGHEKSPPREETFKDKIKPMSPRQEEQDNEYSKNKVTTTDDKKTLPSYSWRSFALDQWRNPSYYMPAAVILIMVLLVFFGRSVAILCTSIGWYMIPAPRRPSNGGIKTGKKKKKKKKEHGHQASRENRNVHRDGSHSLEESPPHPQQHGHQKSW